MGVIDIATDFNRPEAVRTCDTADERPELLANLRREEWPSLFAAEDRVNETARIRVRHRFALRCPALKRWACSTVPTGLAPLCLAYPALKCWASVNRPYGTCFVVTRIP